MRQERGKWLADGFNEHGVRKRHRFATKEQAQQFEDKLLHHKTSHHVGALFPKFAHEVWAGTKNEYEAIKLTHRVIKALGPKTAIKSIDRARIKKLSEGWLAEGNTQSTVNRKLSCLSKLLKHAVEEEVIDEAPSISLKHDPDARRFRVFSYEEEDALIANLRYEVDRRFVGFLIDTGCRYGETERLTWLDVSHNQRTITIWKSKTGKPRTIPLTDRAYDALEWVRRQGRERPWEDITYRAFMQRWHAAREAAGLGEDCIPYVCRHTCATRLALGRMDVFRLMQWMGHTNVMTTRRYIQLDSADLQTGVDILSRRKA